MYWSLLEWHIFVRQQTVITPQAKKNYIEKDAKVTVERMLENEWTVNKAAKEQKTSPPPRIFKERLLV
jgi:hypothetical protein